MHLGNERSGTGSRGGGHTGRGRGRGRRVPWGRTHRPREGTGEGEGGANRGEDRAGRRENPTQNE